MGLSRAMEHLVESGVQVHRASKWDLKGALAASRQLSGALINWELGREGELKAMRGFRSLLGLGLLPLQLLCVSNIFFSLWDLRLH